MSDRRKGFCVEVVTSGCKCKPLVVYDSDYRGADDFHNLTDGLGLHEVSGSTDNEGYCRVCGLPVTYDDYLVVTSVPKVEDPAAELLECLPLTVSLLKYASTDGGIRGCNADEWWAMEPRCDAAIAQAERRGE